MVDLLDAAGLRGQERPCCRAIVMRDTPRRAARLKHRSTAEAIDCRSLSARRPPGVLRRTPRKLGALRRGRLATTAAAGEIEAGTVATAVAMPRRLQHDLRRGSIYTIGSQALCVFLSKESANEWPPAVASWTLRLPLTPSGGKDTSAEIGRGSGRRLTLDRRRYPKLLLGPS